MLVHNLIDIQVMGLDDVSNCLVKVSSLLIFFGCQFLEFSSVFKHSLGVFVSVLLKLTLMGFSKVSNLLFKECFSVTLIFIERVISISMLKLRT
jgi:hypothetical protein